MYHECMCTYACTYIVSIEQGVCRDTGTIAWLLTVYVHFGMSCFIGAVFFHFDVKWRWLLDAGVSCSTNTRTPAREQRSII